MNKVKNVLVLQSRIEILVAVLGLGQMNKFKNILVLQSRIEILVTVPGLGHGVPVCWFHTFLRSWR